MSETIQALSLLECKVQTALMQQLQEIVSAFENTLSIPPEFMVYDSQISPIDVYDTMTSRGYKLNLVTGEYTPTKFTNCWIK